MFDPLTRRQKEILDYLKEYIHENGYSPSLQEIKTRFKLSAISTVHEHLQNLRKKGYITKEINQARGINLRAKSSRKSKYLKIPKIGVISGSNLILSDKPDWLIIDHSIYSGDNDIYAVTFDEATSKKLGTGKKTLILEKTTTLNNSDQILIRFSEGNRIELGKLSIKNDKYYISLENKGRTIPIKSSSVIEKVICSILVN